MITREKINNIQTILFAASDAVADYREKAFSRDKDDNFADYAAAKAYGESTLYLAKHNGMEDPHVVVGYAAGLVLRLKRLQSPHDYSAERINKIKNNINSIKIIFTYLIYSDKDRNILNTINKDFEQLANNSLSLLKEIEFIMEVAQKNTAANDTYTSQVTSFSSKSEPPTLFKQKIEKRRVDNKKVEAPERHI